MQHIVHQYACDYDQASSFLDLLGDTHTFQTFAEHERGTRALRTIRSGTLAKHHKHLVNVNQHGGNISYMVNAGDGKGRRVENVTKVRALFLDIDEPSEELPPVFAYPSAIVESSPLKYHLYWLVSGFPLEHFSRYQRYIAELSGGDPSAGYPNKTLRIPGFYHVKAEPFMTRIIEITGEVYHFEQIRNCFAAVERREESLADALAMQARMRGEHLRRRLEQSPERMRKTLETCAAKVAATTALRNDTLNKYAYFVAKEGMTDEIAYEALYNAGIACGLEPNETRATILSAFRAGSTVGSSNNQAAA